MRVFLAGASGAIGRPLVPKLIAAGHEVTGMTRSEARAEEIRATGAAAAVVDVFDADALRAAMAAASPEVVIHQLTALPDRMDFRKKDLYTLTNRLRTEGTRNLLDGARDAGARRFVSQSIAFAYRNDGSLVKTEDEPLLDDAPAPFDERHHRAPRDGGHGAWRRRPRRPGAPLRVLLWPRHALRPGRVGRGGRPAAAPAGRGQGHGRVLVHPRGRRGRRHPRRRRARGAGRLQRHGRRARRDERVGSGPRRRRRRQAPAARAALVGEVGGRQAGRHLRLELRGASNEKAKRELGWQPAHPSWRGGFAESLAP